MRNSLFFLSVLGSSFFLLSLQSATPFRIRAFVRLREAPTCSTIRVTGEWWILSSNCSDNARMKSPASRSQTLFGNAVRETLFRAYRWGYGPIR